MQPVLDAARHSTGLHCCYGPRLPHHIHEDPLPCSLVDRLRLRGPANLVGVANRPAVFDLSDRWLPAAHAAGEPVQAWSGGEGRGA
jgi:hypothetical protein